MDPSFHLLWSAVAHDLLACGFASDQVVRLLDEPVAGQFDTHSFWLLGSGGIRTGVIVARSLPAASALVVLADQVQEVVVEELPRLGLPAVWPPCPAHPGTHPLAAVEDADGSAVWSCPRSGDVVAAIGRL